MSGPFKMKNPGLNMSARTGSPMQANYASPAKMEGHHNPEIKHTHDSEDPSISRYPGSPGNPGGRSESDAEMKARLLREKKEKEEKETPAEYASPAKQKEEKKVKIHTGGTTEYVKGGREGDKRSKHTSYSKPDEGGKVTKTTMKVKKRAFGPSKIKTKTKTISAKRAAKQQKRKDKRHTTIEE